MIKEVRWVIPSFAATQPNQVARATRFARGQCAHSHGLRPASMRAGSARSSNRHSTPGYMLTAVIHPDIR